MRKNIIEAFYVFSHKLITKKLLISVIFLLLSVALIPIFINGVNSIKETQSTNSSASQTDFSFGAVGDWGCNSHTNDTVNNILSKKIELVIGLGDYSYEPTANCWFKIVHPIEDRMKIVIGNHDPAVYPANASQLKAGFIYAYNSPFLLSQYMSQFGLTKEYYSFNYHNIHFLIMSTQARFDNASEQYAFVRNDLAAASTNSSIRWIIVCFHNPMYTSPSPSGIIPFVKFRDIYHPLFDKYKVDLVLEGHNHNYQRSYPLEYNPSSPFNPLITSPEQNNYTNPKGQIFLIIGTGGEAPFQLSGQYPFIAIQLAPAYGLHKVPPPYGFLKVNVVNDGQTLIGTFYPNDGKIMDHFRINKFIA